MQYQLVAAIFRLLSKIPFCVMYVISDCLYYIVYYVVRYRRKIVRNNLLESFPDKSVKEILRIEKKFYRFFMDLIVESCKEYGMSPEQMKRRMVYVNPEMANDLMREGRSISAYLGHYGNWEWVGTSALWFDPGFLSVNIYHKLNNPIFDKIVLQMRERYGSIGVQMHEVARFVNQTKTEGTPFILGLLADQSPRKKEIKHYLEFLNHDAPVLTGTEKLTKHYDLVALFITVRRKRRGYYECEFSMLSDNPKELKEFELTELYFKRLEQEIIHQPELYLWSHKRFRNARALIKERSNM